MKTKQPPSSPKPAGRDVRKPRSLVRDSGAQSPALDRALALLEFISERSEGVTQTEIRKGLGFSANLVFRLTKALGAHGYIDRDEPGPRYSLSGKLLSLAQPRREQRSLVQIAYQPLRWLRDVTGESSHIGVRSGFECIVLDRVAGPHAYQCYVEAGTRGTLHTGAPGKVMLAFLPAHELEATLREMPLSAETPNTITSREELARHLAEVREKGYAMDLGETVEVYHCLGAPVFDVDGRPLASIWITAPAPRLTRADGKRLAPHVIKAAEMISQALRRRPENKPNEVRS